jgi:hypothetical protein
MAPADLLVRNTTYAQIVARGRVPDSGEVADVLRIAVAGVRDSWRRMHDAHALVLEPSGTEVLMANPFSAVPTPFRVQAAGRSWYANCAWDAFGICAALDSDGEIDTRCPDCGKSLSCQVRDRGPAGSVLLFHCLVPAAGWWDDIVFS